jgi:hypothetical protein
MSAFCGLVTLRKFHFRNPELELTEVIRVARRLSADDAHHDYEAAILLHDVVETDSGIDDTVTLYRETIAAVIREEKPWWVRFAPLGRERLRSALTMNEAQCFEAAGLFSDMPTREVFTWWDALAQSTRSAEDDSRLRQGREAEQLTIAFERARLLSLGITLEPRWISLDDNTVGYDVQSFDTGVFFPTNKLIEVKSCARSATEIFITRNEWETAISSSPNYIFHIWLLPEKELIELKPEDLKPHIPENRGRGVWQNVRVAIDRTF